MAQRISEDDVRSALTWARNYGEIESYASVAESGRRWLVVLPHDDITVQGSEPGWLSTLIPRELVLTSREALVFGFGCAVAGARPEPRSTFAKREWSW